MTSNKGTKKKAKTKSLSNGRRKKNIVERQRDVMDRDVSYDNLYTACNKFFDESADYEYMHSRVGQVFFDQLRDKYDTAQWVTKRLRQDFVGNMTNETTTSSYVYKPYSP